MSFQLLFVGWVNMPDSLHHDPSIIPWEMSKENTQTHNVKVKSEKRITGTVSFHQVSLKSVLLTNQPTIGHGVETLTSTVINLFPCAHSRYSGTSEHDETRQRFVLGLLWLWRNQGGVGPRVHQLLAVQEQRHGQVVSTVCAEQWCLWAGARAFRDPPGGAGVQAAETASDSSVFPPRRSSHFISFICSRRKSPQCRIY